MKKVIVCNLLILVAISGFSQVPKTVSELYRTVPQVNESVQKGLQEAFSAVETLGREIFIASPSFQIGPENTLIDKMTGQNLDELVSTLNQTNSPQVLSFHKTSMRLVDVPKMHEVIFPQQDQMYVPLQLVMEESKSVFRGMKIKKIDTLKTILRDGMDVNKSSYRGQVFTTPSLRIALNYALPSKYDIMALARGDINIPVLIRIRLTDEMMAAIPSGQMGLQRIFYNTIPTQFVSDVMVFVEVDGKQAWYKAVLKDGELSFLAVPNQTVKVGDDFFVAPGQTFQIFPQNEKQVFASLTANDKAVSSAASDFRVLPDEQLRAAISNDDEMRLFVPETFVQEDHMFYRGLRLKNTAELQHILRYGMEVEKTHHEVIYVSPNVSIAMGYMFPSQTARLLGTHEGEEALPVLVKIPVTERLLEENPPQRPQEEFGGRRMLYNNVPADMISDVAVYVQINGVAGWYNVTLKNDKLVFMPIPTKTVRGWIAQ